MDFSYTFYLEIHITVCLIFYQHKCHMNYPEPGEEVSGFCVTYRDSLQVGIECLLTSFDKSLDWFERSTIAQHHPLQNIVSNFEQMLL